MCLFHRSMVPARTRIRSHNVSACPIGIPARILLSDGSAPCMRQSKVIVKHIESSGTNCWKRELRLKDQIERLAVLRRQLPKGPLIAADYVFREGPSDLRDESPANFRDVRFSELFAPGKDSLIVDRLMRGPNDKIPCPMCFMWPMAIRESRSTSATKLISCWSLKWISARRQRFAPRSRRQNVFH